MAVEASPGKDTTTGHWEMMGVILDRPYPTYPNGFPPEIIEEFERQSAGRPLATRRIGHGHHRGARRGARRHRLSHRLHVRRQRVPDRLSRGRRARGEALRCASPPAGSCRDRCRRPRDRPPVRGRGASHAAHRGAATSRWSPRPTVLDLLQDRGVPITGVGKMGDIFCWREVHRFPHVTDNMDGFTKLVEAGAGRSDEPGFVFANLVDFDMLWGHRNDVEAYARGLEAVDVRMPGVGGAAAGRGRHDPLRRPRRGPDDGEHRPLARVLAAPGARARARAVRRPAGGRRRHRLRAPDGGGAAAPRAGR